jgi:hypothetical protein
MTQPPQPEFYEDEAGEFRWRMESANNEVVLVSSQGYRDITDAKRGFFDAAHLMYTYIYAVFEEYGPILGEP